MASGYVLVKDSFSGKLGDEVFDFRRGEPVPADHPVVAQWPTMFEPISSRFIVDRKAERVEQATAAPGEKRR